MRKSKVLRMIEPKIGERVAWNNERYCCYERKIKAACRWCDMLGQNACGVMECSQMRRKDGRDVLFIREGHYSRKDLNEILKIIRRKA